MGTGVKR